ncbi:cyanoexosortase C [Anabaena sp. CCY 0017]|uniref:cyanoexosortase C n=1 Tax=Anabaena sp. CCY 0017 TaxID=3103866 RepID=UPI0039C5ADF6
MLKKLKPKQILHYWQQSLKTHHGRMLNLAAVAGLLYFPVWAGTLLSSVISGNASILFNGGFLYFGLKKLWTERDTLRQVPVSRDDRLIGHMLIVGSAFWLPFCRNSVSLQAFVWLIVVLGVGWSSFGFNLFRRYPIASAMILVSMYPSSVFLANRLFASIIEPRVVETFTAWLGSMALQVIGEPAMAAKNLIVVREQSVIVGFACTGFDMALSLTGLSFWLGLSLKQNWWRISMAMVSGIAIAIVFNVPRVVMLVLAVLYWGQSTFDFWHGPWGGQIFSGIMFTVAYYVVFAIYQLNSTAAMATNDNRQQ